MSETRAQYGDGGRVQHAPGPWVFGRGRDDQRLILGGPGRRYVATVQIEQTPRLLGLGEERERLANARLIAAAPDLLNIAQRVVSALEDLEDDPPPRYRTHWHDLRDDARAALNHAAPAAEREG